MVRPRLVALALLLVIVPACRIEDRTPSGTRRDQAAIQTLVAEYARSLSDREWSGARSLFWPDAVYAGSLSAGAAGPIVPHQQALPIDSALRTLAASLEGVGADDYDVRVIRIDLRQEGDVAAAWVTTRRRAPAAGGGVVERDWMEHLVFKQIDGEWRILSVALAATPRRRPGAAADLAEAATP